MLMLNGCVGRVFFFSNVDTYVELLSEIMIFWFYRSLNICINIRNAMASDTS